MIAFNSELQKCKTNWQTHFAAMLPEIEQRLRRAFRHLDPEAREDAVEEGVVHSMFSYCRLRSQGRAAAASSSTLAWYAALRVKRGRPTAGRLNGKELLSRYAQLGSRVQFEPEQGQWIDTLVADKRASVSDQVAAKMDVGAWFATLTKRMKEIAQDLACGWSTSDVATKYGVSASRISQLRRSLEESWLAFQQEPISAP